MNSLYIMVSFMRNNCIIQNRFNEKVALFHIFANLSCLA